MKNRRSHASFIENLRRKVRSLKGLKPHDVHVLTVNANYGHYQIVVGPRRKNRERDLEIRGEIHHLFVSPHSIRPNPSRHQINDNLKGTVIVRDLEVRLHDPKGDGKNLMMKDCEAHPREYINLAGKKGDMLMHDLESGNKLSMAAYRIIQEDILHSLKEETTNE